ncbi:MAG: CvpA family protein [Deltaproteobacteria bacterium]|nr:CvpA family protein [Deltaproteobacteria bacterium]MBW1966062.1 CvpA family protein [Deltaproteobacteria bacterium]MBW2098458.1 CvpA family protein [Deltaproteobacteria bacterium]
MAIDCNFNWLDILLGGMLAFFVCRSLWTGFSRSVASLLGMILGFWVAVHRFSSISFRLSPWIQDEMWRSLVSFMLIFFLVYLIFCIAGIIVQRTLKALQLGWIDRLLGVVVGLAKGLVLAIAIVFMLTIFLPPNSQVLKKSYLYPTLSRIAQLAGSMAPGHLKGRFMWKWRKFYSGPDKGRGQEV